MTVFIYALRCPLSDCIRYIGKAVNLKRRFREHIYSSRRQHCHKDRWIAALRAQRLRPDLVILHSVPDGGDWQELERQEISKALEVGLPLTNITAGGEGIRILDPDLEALRLSRMRMTWQNPELRAAVSSHLKEVFATPQQKARRSEAAKKMWATPSSREKISKSLSAAYSTDAARAALSERGRVMHSDPKFKDRHAAATSAACQKPSEKARRSADMTRQWADHEISSRRAAKMSSGAVREKMSKSAKARWTDPVKREAALAANRSDEKRAKLAAYAHRRSTPEYRAMMAEKTRLSWKQRRRSSSKGKKCAS